MSLPEFKCIQFQVDEDCQVIALQSVDDSTLELFVDITINLFTYLLHTLPFALISNEMVFNTKLSMNQFRCISISLYENINYIVRVVYMFLKEFNLNSLIDEYILIYFMIVCTCHKEAVELAFSLLKITPDTSGIFSACTLRSQVKLTEIWATFTFNDIIAETLATTAAATAAE